jgi:RNA polymerase sigma-70 factor (ECF subfamily)
MPHMDAAYNLARWLTGNGHDADDVVQEAFLRAFKFFDSFRGEDARTWILKIVRNTFYTQWRRSRSRDESAEFDEEQHSLGGDDEIPGASANPESIVASAQDIALLDRALGELPEEFREALVLREIEELSYKEIAATLEIPMGTVMSRIARARRLLLEGFTRLAGARSRGISASADASFNLQAILEPSTGDKPSCFPSSP